MTQNLKARSLLARRNEVRAKDLWPAQSSRPMLNVLRELTTTFGFSIELGELRIIDGHWYVTHSGLLRLATRRRCRGIRVEPVLQFSDPSINRWVFKSTVHKTRHSRSFVGFGDADPSNVSSLVHGAEMRVAETRAVNRALRKAYGIGLCSVEELGWAPRSNASGLPEFRKARTNGNNGLQNGQPRLRDRLCLLIREHHLDANSVLAHGAAFCGTATLREASREQVEAFINDLAERAAKDRDGLTCQLNSYSKSQEVAP
jgi:hypothetical protein